MQDLKLGFGSRSGDVSATTSTVSRAGFRRAGYLDRPGLFANFRGSEHGRKCGGPQKAVKLETPHTEETGGSVERKTSLL